MKGLILKELYLYKGQIRIYAVLFVFYTIYSIVFKNVGMLFMMVAILGVSVMLSGFGVDSQCKWDIYALSTPIGRKRIVISKYLVGLIVISVVTLITVMVSFISNRITKEIPYTEILLMGYGVFAVTAFIIILNMPFIYKLGVEKARYVYLAEMLFPTTFYFILKNSGLGMPSESTIEQLFWISPLLLIVLGAVSIYISIKIYESMEF